MNGFKSIFTEFVAILIPTLMAGAVQMVCLRIRETRASVPEVETTGPIPAATELTREPPVPVTTPVAAGVASGATTTTTTPAAGGRGQPCGRRARAHTATARRAGSGPSGSATPPRLRRRPGVRRSVRR